MGDRISTLPEPGMSVTHDSSQLSLRHLVETHQRIPYHSHEVHISFMWCVLSYSISLPMKEFVPLSQVLLIPLVLRTVKASENRYLSPTSVLSGLDVSVF